MAGLKNDLPSATDRIARIRSASAEFFKDVSARAGFERSQHVALVDMHAEDYDLGGGFARYDLPGRFDPIELRHADIEHGDIGMAFRDKLNGLATVTGFGDDFEIGLLFQQQTQPGSDDRMVVGQENPDLRQSEPRWQHNAPVGRYRSGLRPWISARAWVLADFGL